MFFTAVLGIVSFLVAAICFCVFFDQAVLNRQGTIYRVVSQTKKVALTFDDGPSPIWTPLILDELKKADVKATFFMIGHHVQKYPETARRVAQEGHTIGNHGYAHSVTLYYTPPEIEEEIKYTEHVIRQATGRTTKYFRPPKAWLTRHIKEKIKSMGYEIVLWSLNSKDWVPFTAPMMAQYLERRARGGDIILFHDSGNIHSAEGGNRAQTVEAMAALIRGIRQKGLEFAGLEELLDGR